MDALSDVLRIVDLTGGVFLDAEFTEPWSVSGKVEPELCQPYMVEPEYVVSFHYVVEGAFILTLHDGTSWHVRAGELVMLPRNDLHVFGSAGGLASIGVGALMQRPGVSPGSSTEAAGRAPGWCVDSSAATRSFIPCSLISRRS